MVWILSRTPTLKAKKRNEIENIISREIPLFDIGSAFYETVQGKTCPYDRQPRYGD